MRHASRAVDLEDDPTLVGHVVARQVLGGALWALGDVSEGIEVLQDVLAVAGPSASCRAAGASDGRAPGPDPDRDGDLEGARRVFVRSDELAAAAEQAWGQGAAAALAGLRLAEARMVMATDPGASIPEFQRAVDLAEDWGWATLLLLALVELAAAQWTVGDRAAARLNVAKAREVAATGEARPDAVRRLEAFEARIGRGAVTTARASGALAGGAHGP